MVGVDDSSVQTDSQSKCVESKQSLVEVLHSSHQLLISLLLLMLEQDLVLFLSNVKPC